MYKVYICILLTVIASCKTVFSQSRKVVEDTLTQVEIQQLEIGLKKSTFYAFYMADSFSRRRDTVHCGEWFSKIDPYYFLSVAESPANPDSFLNKFRLPEQIKSAYRNRYNVVYSTSITKDFLLMKQLRDEDQDIRAKLERCGDSTTCSMLKIKMKYTDSIHFEKLYKYVQENGWPSIANGSLFAALIAVHDNKRVEYYVPIFKQAIIDGKLPFEPLKLIFAKKKFSNSSFDDLRKRIDTSVKYSFVVNQLLEHRMPTNVEDIKKTIKKHCPNLDVLLIYQKAFQFDNYLKWLDKENSIEHSNGESIIQQFFNEFQVVCSSRFTKDVWSVYCLPTERKTDQIMFYILLK